MTPQEFNATPLGILIADSKRRRRLGLRFVLTDPDDPEFCHKVGRVFDLTIEDLRRMVDVFDSLGETPEGYTLEIQPVRHAY